MNQEKEYGLYLEGNEEPPKDFTTNQKVLSEEKFITFSIL